MKKGRTKLLAISLFALAAFIGYKKFIYQPNELTTSRTKNEINSLLEESKWFRKQDSIQLQSLNLSPFAKSKTSSILNPSSNGHKGKRTNVSNNVRPPTLPEPPVEIEYLGQIANKDQPDALALVRIGGQLGKYRAGQIITNEYQIKAFDDKHLEISNKGKTLIINR